jgi:hypothetical protein
MNKLYAFLHPEIPEEKEVIISTRFKDEEGNPVPFRIRPITGEENDALIKKCTTQKKSKNDFRKFDAQKYNRALVVAATVVPDFRDAELCQAYGVVDPEALVTKMLLVGEYQKLSEEVLLLSGLDDDSAEDTITEAKN